MTRYTAELNAALKKGEPWALKKRQETENWVAGRDRRASSVERERIRMWGPDYDPSKVTLRNAAEEAKQREKENAERAKQEEAEQKNKQEVDHTKKEEEK